LLLGNACLAAAWAPFTTSATGTLEVIVRWNNPNADVDVQILRGNWTCPQQEDQVAESVTTNKPERLTVNNFAAGSYTVNILNLGPTVSGSGTIEIWLTS
jgi:hypothetical protein